jgi:nucleotide-binding universal stress UspA family protein
MLGSSINAMAERAYGSLVDDINQKATDTQRKIAEKFGSDKVSLNVQEQSQQHVADVIVKEAFDWRSDLVIMGAHGASGYNEEGEVSSIADMINPAPGTFDANAIGSVAAGVLNHAPCSVQLVTYITSHATEMDERKKVSSENDNRFLLAVNDSRAARAVVDEVLARPWLPTSSFQVIAVVEEPKSIVHSKLLKEPDIDAAHKQLFSEQKSKLEKLAEGFANEIKQKHGKNQVIHHVLEGNVRSCILQIAQDWGADMIMIGAHDRDKSIMEHFLGSVARAVVDNADCSVEVVRPRKA